MAEGTKKQAKRLYRAGLNPDCPLHFATAGGVTFPKQTERVTGYGSETKRVPRPGSIVRLTDDQYRVALERLGNRVVRVRQGRKGVNAQVYDVTTHGFEPSDEHDTPLGKWAYLEPIEDEDLKPKPKPTLQEAAAKAAEEAEKRKAAEAAAKAKKGSSRAPAGK